jgi:hypothetical protein
MLENHSQWHNYMSPTSSTRNTDHAVEVDSLTAKNDTLIANLANQMYTPMQAEVMEE